MSTEPPKPIENSQTPENAESIEVILDSKKHRITLESENTIVFRPGTNYTNLDETYFIELFFAMQKLVKRLKEKKIKYNISIPPVKFESRISADFEPIRGELKEIFHINTDVY